MLLNDKEVKAGKEDQEGLWGVGLGFEVATIYYGSH